MLFATRTDEETGMYHWRLFGGKAKTAGPRSEPCGHLGEVGSYAAAFSALTSADFGVISAIASSAALVLMNSQISSFSA